MKDRFQIAALMLSYVAWGAFWGAWGVLIPRFKNELSLSDAAIGAMLMGISIGAIPSMLYGSGFIARRPRAALKLLLAAFAASVVLLSQAFNGPTLLCALMLVGMSSGLLDIALNINVSNAERKEDRPLFQLMFGLFPLGVIVAAPLVGAARDAGLGTLNILAAVAALFVLPALLLGWRETIETAQGSYPDAEAGLFGRLQRAAEVFNDKSVVFVSFLIIVFLILENAIEQWSTLYVEQTYHRSPGFSSFAPSLYMAMSFLGRMAAQRFEGKLPLWRLLSLGALGASLCFLGIALAGSAFGALFAVAAAGLVMAPMVPALYGWVSGNVLEERRARVLGSFTAISYLGYLLSPPLVGSVSGLAGLSGAWASLAGLSLMSGVLVAARSRLLRPRQLKP